MNRLSAYFIVSMIVSCGVVNGYCQQAYYIDGYHGGIYGHIPSWQTRFMVDKLKQHPEWSINLELEPESWDTIRLRDTAAYAEFREMVADPATSSRIEYINPAYGQSYLYTVEGESMIRQFYYGIRKLREHFPGMDFQTYSSEEPCFTSALPGVLKSFGFRYASLKNPNTCWGGYTRAFGGEAVNWVGPDGTKLLTVPRYAVEDLQEGSTWQTIAFGNGRHYIGKAFAAGIRHPVGMTLQDAGWAYGPFLGAQKDVYMPTAYTTWREYFKQIVGDGTAPDWHFSQEDVLVSLMWGSQILQCIAREVRASEHRILMTEKMAAIASLVYGASWPGDALDAGWRTLLLSQHHDCWIVPYNGKPGDSWADKVVRWTGNTDSICSRIRETVGKGLMRQERAGGAIEKFIVLNTTGFARDEFVRIGADDAGGVDDGNGVGGAKNRGDANELVEVKEAGRMVRVRVPAMGYTMYSVKVPHADTGKGSLVAKSETYVGDGGCFVVKQKDGMVRVETDLYSVLIDGARGGIIRSLRAKKLGGYEFVDQSLPAAAGGLAMTGGVANGAATAGFNALRGNFYQDGGFRSSSDSPAEVRVMEDDGVRVRVEISGKIDGSPFRQELGFTQGEPRIDCRLKIDWSGNPGVGESAGPSSDKEVRKSYYDDRYKLLALFPVAFPARVVYKDAPFDVMKSGLQNTFFNRWDSIKNNVLLNWVDVEDGEGKYGLALFSDHTTSYVHGEGYPLGLTVQYSGNGIFYRNYRIDGPTELRYALLPHAGNWKAGRVYKEAEKWQEPLVVYEEEGKGKGGDVGEGSGQTEGDEAEKRGDIREEIGFVKSREAEVSGKVAGDKAGRSGDARIEIKVIKRKGLLEAPEGWEISSVRMEGKDLLVRVFNAAGATKGVIWQGFRCEGAVYKELDGRNAGILSSVSDGHEGGAAPREERAASPVWEGGGVGRVEKVTGRIGVSVTIPVLGFRTICFKQVKY